MIIILQQAGAAIIAKHVNLFINSHNHLLVYIQINIIYMSSDSKKTSLEELRQQSKNTEIQKFIRSYELKQQAVKELVNVYIKNVLNPHFDLTFKAAVALITLPGLTNIYYLLRPHSILAGVMPFAMPLLCLSNYIYFLNKDFQNYCFTEEADAEKVREQYDILYEFSYFNKQQNQFMSNLQNFRRDRQKIKEKANV